jgi:hypothetical protein
VDELTYCELFGASAEPRVRDKNFAPTESRQIIAERFPLLPEAGGHERKKTFAVVHSATVVRRYTNHRGIHLRRRMKSARRNGEQIFRAGEKLRLDRKVAVIARPRSGHDTLRHLFLDQKHTLPQLSGVSKIPGYDRGGGVIGKISRQHAFA